ncbi:HD domain-containing protein [Cellvibrio sp. KY-GH-1]|uniref:HD domain-containing protein n=1 Tax=Cellvibrio sp. KY-GH-1 TaxID=2303332 RepID=UPI001244BE97|nr:HD domain-containing protein [Cellvibrio sp. KY-GH-1]QEY17938.1 HD domain-containing protein [Cellvibrio sp. KY-GH-1]
MNQIDEIFSFIVEIEKLKNVIRKTKPVGLNRYENSGEHSWHVCLVALLFKEYANFEINIDRVIKMLLIHDLGEIDAGDTIIYAGETKEIKELEAVGAQRVFGLLPDHLAEELLLLWREFEEGITPDAIYAKSIDRIPPLLHNLYGNGHSWKDNNVSPEQVYSINSRIAKGSEQVWENLRKKLKVAEAEGILK